MKKRIKRIGVLGLSLMLVALPVQTKMVYASAQAEITEVNANAKAAAESKTEKKSEESAAESKTETKTEETAAESKTETKTEETATESKTETKTEETATESKTETKTEETATESKTETKPEETTTETESKTETKPEETTTETESKTETKPEETATETESKTETKPEDAGTEEAETKVEEAATEENTPAPTEQTAVGTVQIPNVTGMTEEEALALLGQVVLPGGGTIEVIKAYAYSAEYAEGVVYEQSLLGDVSAEQAGSINLSISMGEEPEEVLDLEEEESVNRITTFGIAEYLDERELNTATSTGDRASTSQFGIDWDSLPASYEYNWDNSVNCWYWGVWVDGVRYTTPVGQYSTDVRHKIQIYCDGTYVYTHVIFSRDYWNVVCGDDYRYYFDNQMTAFQLTAPGGGSIEQAARRMSAGTHQIEVRHRSSWISGKNVEGAVGYLTKYEDNVNAQVEFKIPLSEMMRQNDRIDMENLGTIKFYTPNLMYRTITASGADTLPMVTAGVSLLLIPGSSIILKKFRKKKKNDEENV